MNARDLTDSLGGVWRNGRGSAPCPVCQPERRRDQTALSVAEADGRLLLHCFKSNCSFRDIAAAANVPPGRAAKDPCSERERDAARRDYDATKLAKAQSLWMAAKPIRHTRAAGYLRERGITCELPDSLRFAPDIFHSPTMTWCTAMVAKVSPTGAAHRTFFDKKGKRLPADKSPKMMLGACSGGAVVLSEEGGPLVVCEGIETGLSLLSGLLDRPASIWAALSTSGMVSLRLPSRPGHLIVATDGDAAGREAGHKLAQRASAAGWQVSTLAAPDGQDWNDVLRKGGVR